MADEKRHALADPTSLVFGITSTVIMGVLPLIDASVLKDQQRRVVHIATAAFTGLYLGITIGGKRLLSRLLVGLAAGGAALRFADVADVIDARIEEKLRRAGTRHPRRWMAVGTAAFTVIGFLSDRATARRRSTTEPADPTEPTDQPPQDSSPL